MTERRTEQKPAHKDNVYQTVHTLFRFVIYLAAVNVHPVALSRKGWKCTCFPERSPASSGRNARACNKPRSAPSGGAAARRPYLRKHVRAVLKHTVRSARAPTGAAEAAALPGSPCGVILPPDDRLRLVGPEGFAEADRRLGTADRQIAVRVVTRVARRPSAKFLASSFSGRTENPVVIFFLLAVPGLTILLVIRAFCESLS